jgi:hypothetical protein
VILVGSAVLAMWFDTILQMLKFVWEFNAILAAAFWCGIKWRGANRHGAWASMATALLLFALLPACAPVLAPSLRTNEALLKRTEPAPVTHTYRASRKDVRDREAEIERWRNAGQAGERPGPIATGDPVTRTFQPPRKAIFWSKGIQPVEGRPQGEGLLYLDMVLVDRVTDLARYPYAVIETIRVCIRIVLPFAVLILVSLLTPSDGEQLLHRFFMKMRTPVRLDRAEDARQVELSLADPARHRDRLLLPNTRLEYFRWTREDAIGFALSVLTVFAIIGLLYLILGIGA